MLRPPEHSIPGIVKIIEAFENPSGTFQTQNLDLNHL